MAWGDGRHLIPAPARHPPPGTSRYVEPLSFPAIAGLKRREHYRKTIRQALCVAPRSKRSAPRGAAPQDQGVLMTNRTNILRALKGSLAVAALLVPMAAQAAPQTYR